MAKRLCHAAAADDQPARTGLDTRRAPEHLLAFVRARLIAARHERHRRGRNSPECIQRVSGIANACRIVTRADDDEPVRGELAVAPVSVRSKITGLRCRRVTEDRKSTRLNSS